MPGALDSCSVLFGALQQSTSMEPGENQVFCMEVAYKTMENNFNFYNDTRSEITVLN